MHDLLADLETRSFVDLKAGGARRYAADRSTQITTAMWFFHGVKKSACTVHPFLGTHPISQLYADIAECIRLGGRFIAHHVNFDANVIAGPNQCPFLIIPVENVSCTMARAQALALPAGLDELCMALNLKGKDPRGRALVQMTCRIQPSGPWKGRFNEDVEVYRELMAYNDQDVNCLIAVHQTLPELPPAEREIFERTWRKNDRGLPIDLTLANAIAARRAEIEFEISQQLAELTSNVVTAVTQRKRILDWANGGNRAAGLTGTKKHEVAEALENPDLHPDVRVVLEILQESGGSAPTKAQALLNRHVGGFYKDGTRYFGARSGRGTSEGANMFNIARPSGKYDTARVIEGLKLGFKYDNTALTDALRGTICALPGYAIIDNDLSNAEYRLAMWQAGDDDRLRLLAADQDPYMYNAVRMGWVPAEALQMDKEAAKKRWPHERQNAKPVTLGGNYQLGWRTYKASLRKTGQLISDEKAQDDINGYRNANPLLKTLWKHLKDAFWNCIYEPPGRYFYAGKVAFIKDGTTIWLILPSGRAVPHYSVYVGQDGNMGFWRARFGAMLPQKVFGGSLLEITCQCMTRDLITAIEGDVEREMPDVILLLDIYDSVVAMAPVEVAKQRAEQMRAIMRRPRPWTAGLPIDAEGYVAERMKK